MQSSSSKPFVELEHENEKNNKLLTQIIYEFAENTTLNGLKYIAEKGTSILERLFWISTFILSTVLCIMMVYKSYVKYDTGGVAITSKERILSVNEYPFPAVTICSQARIKQSIYNYTRNALLYKNNSTQNWTSAEHQTFHSTLVLCDVEKDIPRWYPFLDYGVDMDTFFQVAPKRDDIFDKCSWRNKVDCSKKFRATLTADGVCYTFNNLASDEIFRKTSIEHKLRRFYLNSSTPRKGWSLEENYYSSNNDTFPRRGRANGAREDLYLVLKEVTDRDFGCEEQTRPGYKVYLHHPADLPQASLHSYTAQPGKTTSLAIRLDILDTAPELADYSPNVRQCYFPFERYLHLFQEYTSLNCQLECLTNYTVRSCGCVSFYMPRNDSTNICKGDKWQCMQDALDQYADEEDLNDDQTSRCGCLPSCKDVNYDAEVVVTKLDVLEFEKRRKELIKNIQDISYDNGESLDNYESQTETTNKPEAKFNVDTFDDLIPDNDIQDEQDENDTVTKITQIRIYYRHPRFVAMERSELVGLSQFLADVGGTLGLFLGFSFLTLAEIIYFFTIKFFCLVHRNSNSKSVETGSLTNDL